MQIEEKDSSQENLKKEERGTEDENSPVSQAEKSFLQNAGIFFLELVKIVVLATITIVLVRYFLFKPFYVKGESMEPTFHEREYLIIDEITYRFRDPQRGEVVVFEAPFNNSEFYLKRVIGLPGERIKIEDNKVIVYNGTNPQGMVLEEIYLDEETPGSVSVTLGPGQFFVLGDNRDASFDSRRFGPVSKGEIVGRAWLRGWPFNKFGVYKKPEYNF